jgi:hypothetical protein
MANPAMKKLIEEMEGINWGTGERLAPGALSRAPAAAAARPRSRSRSRSRSRGRSRSRSRSGSRRRSGPRHPIPEQNEELGWVIEGANGKLKQTEVWNADGDYGGPYSNPMNLLKSKRFRNDYKDLYGKRWQSQFAKERAYESLYKIMDSPKKGDHIYDPEHPYNTDTILMYDGKHWIHPFDPLGQYGGPYLMERELLAVPEYRANQARVATAAAAAAGVSLPEKVFAEHIKMVPEGKRAEAEAEGYPKFTSAVAAAAGSDPTLMSDETKLAARARRALKGFLPEAAAPAPRQKAAKKGGARRTRRGRKGTRKGRATRRH